MKHQIIGLTPDAQNWLGKNAKTRPTRTCPRCKVVLEADIESWEYSKDEPFPLLAYSLSDGSTVMEIVQTIGKGKGPASEVPLVFLCLKTMDGKTLFEWPDYLLRIWKEK